MHINTIQSLADGESILSLFNFPLTIFMIATKIHPVNYKHPESKAGLI
jgi:hypothetical protein